jgi:hypothetical protein
MTVFGTVDDICAGVKGDRGDFEPGEVWVRKKKVKKNKKSDFFERNCKNQKRDLFKY